MTIVFVLGKPAPRSPAIAAVIEVLQQRGVPVRWVAPQAADDGGWTVAGTVRPVGADLDGARLVAQRGLAPQVLDQLGPWARRCCNDPVGTALTHRRPELLQVLGSAGLRVPHTEVVHDYRAARAGGRDGAVVKAVDARVGRGAGVLLPGTAPDDAPFAGPYLIQEHLVGWEAKMYVLGDQVRAAWRPGGHQRGGQEHQPGPELVSIARAVAQVTGLHLCGVDLMITDDGPVVIDVNAFPSATKISGAVDLMATHLAAHWEGLGHSV